MTLALLSTSSKPSLSSLSSSSLVLLVLLLLLYCCCCFAVPVAAPDFAIDVDDVDAMLQEQEVDFAADVSSLADTTVDVTGSFEVPGLLHIIHNAGRSLEITFMFSVKLSDGYRRWQPFHRTKKTRIDCLNLASLIRRLAVHSGSRDRPTLMANALPSGGST